MRVDKSYYPGWVRKAITFTIDDGNIPLDQKLIDIVKPNGIKGTFNLCAPDLKKYTPEFYRDMYAGFGISNHCKLHPFALTRDKQRDISPDSFDIATADENKLYKTQTEGVYYYHTAAGWRKIADSKAYCTLVRECREELEAVFGAGSVTGFVWPYCEQEDPQIQNYVMNECGYAYVRKTGIVDNTTGFSVPQDTMHWSYNATHKNLLTCAADFESYPDDGELKFFCFGLHSHDYERGACWHLLEEFARKYGNRPYDFWYASVEDIFSYRDALNSLIITDSSVQNPSDAALCIKIDGKEITLPPRSVISL